MRRIFLSSATVLLTFVMLAVAATAESGPPQRQLKVYPFTYRAKGLQWVNNDQQLVLTAPNTTPCLPPNNEPDLFVVDAASGELRMQLTTGLLVGAVAVTPNGRAWVVDSGCRGVFTNRAPKMKVFDLHTGKQLHQLQGGETGVRYAVSASENADRIVAYTGKVKTVFDWGDMVSYDYSIDGAFSVWNGNSYEGIVTSQSLPVAHQSAAFYRGLPSLRISSKGGFVLFGANIYELP